MNTRCAGIARLFVLAGVCAAGPAAALELQSGLSAAPPATAASVAGAGTARPRPPSAAASAAPAAAASTGAAAVGAGARGRVQGSVHNDAEQPWAGVGVHLEDDAGHVVAATTTDARGAFAFEDVPPGHYAAVLQTQAATRSEVTVAPGQTAETHLDQGTVLSGVQVVARRLEEARNVLNPVTGGSQTQFTQKAIQALPQGDHTPINEVLQQAPGVSADEFGQIHVRDDHNDLQFRINGILLPDGVSGFASVFDTRFAKTIALNTGALPAQFGLRTAGIVDIATRDRFDGGDLDLYGGSNGLINPSFQFGKTVGRFSFYSTGQFLRTGLGVENSTPAFSAIHDDSRQAKGFMYGSYLLGEHTKLTGLFGITAARLEIPDSPGQIPDPMSAAIATGALIPPGQNSATLDDRQYERNLYGILALQGVIGERAKYQVALFQRTSTVEFQPDFAGELAFNYEASRIKRKASAYGVQSDFTLDLTDQHTLGFGGSVSVEDDRADNTSDVYATVLAVPPGSPPGTAAVPTASGAPFAITDNNPKNGNTLLSLYLQDQWFPVASLTVNYGVRYDRLNAFVDDQAWSPRLGLVWHAGPHTTVHGGVAKYFTPPPNELVSNHSLTSVAGTTNGPAFLGNLDVNSPVRAERADYVDLGVSQRLGRTFTIGLDGYYKHARDLLDEGQFGNALIFTPFNYEQAHIYGLELSSAFHQGKFSAYLNLARQNAQGTGIESGEFNFPTAEFQYINAHYIYLDHDEHVVVSGGASYVLLGTTIGSDFTSGDGLRNGDHNAGKEPWNAQVNVFASRPFHLWEFGEVDLRVVGLNILDRTNQIRDGTGIGVSTPRYGTRASAFVGITKPFGQP